jgi:hypothetical protein
MKMPHFEMFATLQNCYIGHIHGWCDTLKPKYGSDDLNWKKCSPATHMWPAAAEAAAAAATVGEEDDGEWENEMSGEL